MCWWNCRHIYPQSFLLIFNTNYFDNVKILIEILIQVNEFISRMSDLSWSQGNVKYVSCHQTDSIERIEIKFKEIIFLFLKVLFSCLISLHFIFVSKLFSSVHSLSHVWLFPTPWLQHASFPCLSPTPRACSNSCPSSRWCHPTISSSVVPFSSCLQSLPATGSSPINQFSTSGAQSIGASASASVTNIPMNVQDWFPLGLISLQFKGLSRVFNITVQKHQFFGIQLSLWSCYAWCLNPWAGREKASKTMQLTKKGKFITDSSQGSCHNQRSGAGSESPEPMLLSKFIGCA